MTDRVVRDLQALSYPVRAKLVGDLYNCGGWLAHAAHDAKLVSKGQANKSLLCQNSWRSTVQVMNGDTKPFSDIAERLRWHRDLEGLTQAEYAARIGVKRSAYSLWEAGSHRLSLDGALALRKRWGLSLDFMYEGNDDALPMTLRSAWRDRPRVSASR